MGASGHGNRPVAAVARGQGERPRFRPPAFGRFQTGAECDRDRGDRTRVGTSLGKRQFKRAQYRKDSIPPLQRLRRPPQGRKITKHENGRRHKSRAEHRSTRFSSRDGTDGKQSRRQGGQLCQDGIICEGGSTTGSKADCVSGVLLASLAIGSFAISHRRRWESSPSRSIDGESTQRLIELSKKYGICGATD